MERIQRLLFPDPVRSLPYGRAWNIGFRTAHIGVTGILLHGAVGYTEDYDCQLYLKRSKWARPAYGDEDYHYERVATLGGV